MTTVQAAKKVGLARTTLLARAKAAGRLPKRVVHTGRRGRPTYLWTERQARLAAGA